MKQNKLTFKEALCGLVLTCFLFLGTTAAEAKEQKIAVYLKSIDAQKTSEKAGDEIYIDITQYSNMGGSKILRVPELPLHWRSKDLAQVKDLKLWEGTVQDNEEFKLIFSVVEQDNPPWDVDELIGSSLLEIENNEGKLKYHWELPVFEDRVEQEMLPGENPKRFIMKGEHSQYAVDFVVKENGH